MARIITGTFSNDSSRSTAENKGDLVIFGTNLERAKPKWQASDPWSIVYDVTTLPTQALPIAWSSTFTQYISITNVSGNYHILLQRTRKQWSLISAPMGSPIFFVTTNHGLSLWLIDSSGITTPTYRHESRYHCFYDKNLTQAWGGFLNLKVSILAP